MTDAYLEYAKLLVAEYEKGARGKYFKPTDVEASIQNYVPALLINKVPESWFIPDIASPDVAKVLGPIGRLNLAQRGILSGQGYSPNVGREYINQQSFEMFLRLTDQINSAQRPIR